MTHLLDSLAVSFGELTPNRAVIHARLTGGVELAGLSLAGTVRGPRCSLGNTLPATYRLGSVGQVSNLPYVSAQALITEPVFWTPDWPALYDVAIELRQGSNVLEQTTRTLGLRPLAVVGKDLVYGGKRWVVRGIRCERLLPADIGKCRSEAALLVLAAELDERLMTMASEEGTLVIAELSAANAAAELLRLSRHAAVAMAIAPKGVVLPAEALATNIVLAHRLKQGEVEPLPDHVRVVLGGVTSEASFGQWAAGLARPVIAFRPLDEMYETLAARMECDRLQRDLAPYGQFAGYIV